MPDLLQLIFVGELLSPSRCLWIVSPWISDIPIIDNSANNFSMFEPHWGRTHVRLSQVVGRLLELGTTVHVATRPLAYNESFLERLRRHAESEGLPLRLHVSEELHEKGHSFGRISI